MTEQELDASDFAPSLEWQRPQIAKLVFRQHRTSVLAGFFRHVPKAGGTSGVLSECDGVIVITTHDHRTCCRTYRIAAAGSRSSRDGRLAIQGLIMTFRNSILLSLWC
jgi:hypothetical protein